MQEDTSGKYEWTALMLNINSGNNGNILSRCKPLSDYMEFVARVREGQKIGMTIEEAVDEAVESCIKDGIMADFLIKHKAEVKNVCITEFNEKLYADSVREEGAKGERLNAIQKMIRKGYSKEDILELEYTEEEYSKAEKALLAPV